MGQHLNIKSDEAYQLASRLAELTGQSLTMAVTDALRHRVQATETEREQEAMVRDLLAIGAEIKAELDKAGGDPITSNHDWLYDDESGLPIWASTVLP